MKRPTVLLLIVFILAGCATYNRVKSNRWLAKAKVKESDFYQELSLELRSGFPVFQVALGEDGVLFDFMLDSGGYTVLSKKAIQQTKGIEKRAYIDVRDANKVTNQVDVYELEHLKVGDLNFEKVGFAKIGFTESEFFSCLGIDGTLGPNIMKEGIWHFDYERSKIIFTNQLEKIPQIDQAIRVPISTNNIYKPWIEFMINGETKRAIIDTGANSLFLVPGGDAKKWQAVFPFIEKSDAKVSAGNSAISTDAALIKMNSIDFGSLHLGPVFAETGKYLQDYILGNGVMEYYNLSFNLAENELYFHKRPGVEMKQKLITFGFSFDYENGQLVIGSLYDGGPAQNAGISIGDIVRHINGKSYSFSDYCDFINNFELGTQTTIELEVVRGEQKLSFKLDKAKVL